MKSTLLAFLLACTALSAQDLPLATRTVPHPLRVGPIDGGAEERVETRVVRVPEARWVRVTFAEAALGRSHLVVRSLANPQSWQRFDASTLAVWGNATGFFNGEGVTLELHVAPHDRGVAYRIENVLADANPQAAVGAPNCVGDADDRVQAFAPPVGRFIPVGCTAWIVSNGAVLTAGHCITKQSGSLVEFNVPISRCEGTPTLADVEDQYPVLANTIQSQNTGVGSDWAVLSLGPNAVTGRFAPEVQGYFRILNALQPGWDEVRVSGYGADSDPFGCTYGYNRQNATLQTDFGPLLTPAGPAPPSIIYDVYTTPGTSGCPVFYLGTSFAIGINAGCPSSTTTASATSFGNTQLAQVLEQWVAGASTVYADANHAPQSSETGSIFAPFRSVAAALKAVPSGSTLAMASGIYDGLGVTIPAGKTITFVATCGPVVIGPAYKPD